MNDRTDSVSDRESPNRPNGASPAIPDLFKNAIGAHQAGRFDEAKGIYLQILAIDVRNADALHLLGTAEHQAGHFAIAEKMIRRAIAIKPNEAIYRSNLGLVLQGQGKPEEAVAEYRLAIALRPDFVEAHNNLGNALGELGRLDEAISCCHRALDLRPDFAEASSNLGKTLLSQGKLEEARACIERALSLRPGHAETRSTLGVVLRALGKLEEARICLEQALALDPNNAEAHNNLSNVLREQGDLEGAKACLARAIQLKPDYAVAYNNLGSAFQEEDNLADARTCIDRALALKPDYAEALYGLARLLREQGDPEEAKNCLQRSLKLKPDNAEAMGALGTILFEQCELEAARAQLESALALKPACIEALATLGALLNDLGDAKGAKAKLERAIALKADSAIAHWNLALVQLREGNYSAGWRNFEWRSKIRKLAPRSFSQPLWHGEPLKGATILLHGEQGLGDILQTLRYVPMVKAAGGVVILDIPERLRRLAAQIPELDGLVVSGDPLPPFDLHCPLMSLPLAFATTVASIPARVPYLTVPAEAQQRAEELDWPGEGLRVGLVWAGAPGHTKDRFRSIALTDLTPLFDIPGVAFFSLQMGPAAEQLSSQQASIVDLAPLTGDMADTAAQLAHMDLVICVDTSVAHLAGALGRPAWILLHHAADWRWLLDREDSPWYPTLRLFRQPAAGQWEPVVAHIRQELALLAAGHREVIRGATPPVATAETQPGASAPAQPIAELERRCATIEARETDIERWANEQQLEMSWDSRAQRAADFISPSTVLLDLGCGRMVIERFLPADCRYIPCDLVHRDQRTVLCDFNAGLYPDAEAAGADFVSCLGVLEYLFDPRAFLAHLRQWQHPVILSYFATDSFASTGARRSLGWVNDFSYEQLTAMFAEAGFAVRRAEQVDLGQWLFRLQPGQKVLPAMKRVGVLSYNNYGNFGDRLGYHLLNDLLPAHAEVTQLSFSPWTPSEASYDLLIVGIGNSLFGSALDDRLIELVDRSRAAVGIFGTQYHEALPTSMLEALLQRLEHWYARNEDDIYRYGRNCGHASHLGDWLINAFPMTRPTDPGHLEIGKDIWEDKPLDRTIQKIQSYTTVFSPRIHPLLCALTSAERVGYREQRDMGEVVVSGKFRALLLDVFGRTFPEEKLFDVDRDQVLLYKAAVDARTAAMRDHIRGLLEA